MAVASITSNRLFLFAKFTRPVMRSLHFYIKKALTARYVCSFRVKEVGGMYA